VRKGSKTPKILFVGEVPSDQDVKIGMPFMGFAGQELDRMIKIAGINPRDCAFVHFFPHPMRGKTIENLLVPKAEVTHKLKAIKPGKYWPDEHLPLLDDLRTEIARSDPNVVVPLGSLALWALFEQTSISKYRGKVFNLDGRKLIPVFSPNQVLADWSSRVTVLFDLKKVAHHADSKTFVPPDRRILLRPTLDEALAFIDKVSTFPLVSFDVETKRKTITCISVCGDPFETICIPFYDPTTPEKSYWTESEEVRIWLALKVLMEGPAKKLAQNGLYDIQYLQSHGIWIKNFTHDTMILHHSLYSELPKGLDFLGSIYTDEQPWKLIRNNADFKEDA
jgi:uracil-DNA glycosylase